MINVNKRVFRSVEVSLPATKDEYFLPFHFVFFDSVMAMVIIFLVFLLICMLYRIHHYIFPSFNVNSTGKYVLISGCDTGFGHQLALQLDQCGFHVLAGVYLSDQIIPLKNKLSSRATVFQLDITKSDDIDAAYKLIERKTNSLHALVNNAGIGVSGYIDWISLETMRQTMEVNFFGHVAMTKKFLPLLITKRNSRVINVTSAAGILAASSISAYSASKYALEAFSDCLRREMTPWGLRVSIIEPGFMRTPIILGRQLSFDDIWAKMSKETQENWGEKFLRQQYDIRKTDLFIKHAEDPMKVVRALEHAVINTDPRIRYRPGWQASLLFYPLSMMPAWIVDLLLRNLTKSALVPAGVAKQLQD